MVDAVAPIPPPAPPREGEMDWWEFPYPQAPWTSDDDDDDDDDLECKWEAETGMVLRTRPDELTTVALYGEFPYPQEPSYPSGWLKTRNGWLKKRGAVRQKWMRAQRYVPMAQRWWVRALVFLRLAG